MRPEDLKNTAAGFAPPLAIAGPASALRRDLQVASAIRDAPCKGMRARPKKVQRAREFSINLA